MFVKVEQGLEERPRLWIKAKKIIKRGEEVTVHYGHAMLKELQENGGCKCISCVCDNGVISI